MTGSHAGLLLLRSGQLSCHYWADEGISVGISSHPLSQLPSLLRQDGAPPLYYVLLHFWMLLWGRSEVATHAPSLVFALVAVPVSYWAGASLSGRRVGAYCAVLTAGLPFRSRWNRRGSPSLPHWTAGADPGLRSKGLAQEASGELLVSGNE